MIQTMTSVVRVGFHSIPSTACLGIVLDIQSIVDRRAVPALASKRSLNRSLTHSLSACGSSGCAGEGAGQCPQSDTEWTLSSVSTAELLRREIHSRDLRIRI